MVIGMRFGDSGNQFFWNDQDMIGRGRFDVAECEHEVVLVHYFSWNFAVDDPFKQGFAHGPAKVRLRLSDVNQPLAQTLLLNHQSAGSANRFRGEAIA